MEVSWDEAISAVASGLKSFRKSEIAALGSPFATNEENYLLRRFASEVLGTRHIDFYRYVEEEREDDILIRADRTPNSRGAVEVGVSPREGGLNLPEIIEAIRQGRIKALYVLDGTIAHDPAMVAVFAKLEYLVVHASVENETTRHADVVLPLATYAEKNGTFTNFLGRVQRIKPSVAVLELDRSLDGFSMSRLDRFGTQFDRWSRGLKRDARPAWKIIASIAGIMGTKYRFNRVEDVFSEIARTVPSFKGMSYATLGTRGMALKGIEQNIPETVR